MSDVRNYMRAFKDADRFIRRLLKKRTITASDIERAEQKLNKVESFDLDVEQEAIDCGCFSSSLVSSPKWLNRNYDMLLSKYEGNKNWDCY